jgi:hypothetical protein
MGNYQKPSPRELAEALEMSESQVAVSISAVERKFDGSGHWIYFVPDVSPELIIRLNIAPNCILDTDAIIRLWEDRLL